MTELEPKKFRNFLNIAKMFKKSENVARAQQINNGSYRPNLDSGNSEDTIHKNSLEKAQAIELKKNLNARFNELIEHKDKNKIILILERGYEIDSEQALKLMSDDFKDPVIEQSFIKAYAHSLAKDLKKEIQELAEEPHRAEYTYKNFADKLENVWKHVKQEQLLGDEVYAADFLSDCRKLKVVFEKERFSYAKDTQVSFIKTLSYYIKKIETQHSDYLNHQFMAELDSYSRVFNNFDNLKENMTIGMLDNIKKFNERDLPQSAQVKMREITNIANEIGPNSLNVEQGLEFNNVYKKRFSQVLEEYVSISPRYREKLKSHNENPDVLLLESLDEIKTKLEALFNHVQESKYTRQKVTHKYLKSM